jgi:hypothetical protein
MFDSEEGKRMALGPLFRAIDSVRCQAAVGLLALVAMAAPVRLPAQPPLDSDDAIESRTIEAAASTLTAENIIQGWPKRARSMARVVIEKYGQPDRLSEEALVWYNNGPWQNTVVYRKARPRSLLIPNEDYLKQTISYMVPSDKINALERFNQGIVVNKVTDELSCQSESEDLNFLALNLADEIINNKRSVEDAQDFFLRTQLLSESGKTSPYMQGFRFELFNHIDSRHDYPVEK